MIKSFKNNYNNVKATGKTYLGEMTKFFTFFILVVTFSNLTYTLFGFRLIPLFKTAFDAFHEWCHFLANILFYSWFTIIIQYIWFIITWIGSLVFPIIPWLPNFAIPGLVTDFALVSLAFTRIFQTTDSIVPRSERAKAEKDMTTQQWEEIEIKEGNFWGPIHKFFERINSCIWNLINFLQITLTFRLDQSSKYSKLVRRVLLTLAGSFLMWGYIRLPGYLINIYFGRHLTSPIMKVRRLFFKYFLLNFLGAIGATILFFLINGWIAEWLEP